MDKGVKIILDALTNPKGPKQLTDLNLASKSRVHSKSDGASYPFV